LYESSWGSVSVFWVCRTQSTNASIILLGGQNTLLPDGVSAKLKGALMQPGLDCDVVLPLTASCTAATASLGQRAVSAYHRLSGEDSAFVNQPLNYQRVQQWLDQLAEGQVDPLVVPIPAKEVAVDGVWSLPGTSFFAQRAFLRPIERAFSCGVSSIKDDAKCNILAGLQLG
jgi:hypothetical protein